LVQLRCTSFQRDNEGATNQAHSEPSSEKWCMTR
jgi:hypothetical protein